MQRPHIQCVSSAIRAKPCSPRNTQNDCKDPRSGSRSVPLVAGSGSEEGGERAAGLVGGEEIAEVDQEGAVLQAAGDRRREGAFGEPFAVV